MDPTKFTNEKTGELVRITVSDGEDWAFMPNPLPPDWEFPPRLWPLLADARDHLAELNGIGQTLKNPSLLLTPLQHREALRSSSLEGTYATPMELLLFERHPRDPKAESDRANEWREVANYNSALKHGFERMVDKKSPLPLSKRLIREMHRVLMHGVRGRDKRPGEFRTTQVHIGSDRRYVPPPPERLDESLDDFERNLDARTHQYDPVVMAYIIHYQFEAIHPFRDGNGRVGRVLLSLAVCEWKNLSLPWLYMSPYFERYKEEYIGNLFRVSTHGDWERWIEFCLHGTVIQCKDAIRRCKKLNNTRDHFHESFNGLSPRIPAIIDQLFVAPVCNTNDIMKLCNVSRPTAQADINALLEAGVLEHIADTKKPKEYYSPAILNIAYSEDEDDTS